MSESNEVLIAMLMVMLQAMHEEQQAQVGQVMQRISGMEEQLRGSASKDDVRVMQEQMNAHIRGVSARIDTVNRNLRQLD